jgi:Ca2+-binding EF-hand superfamily protein
MSRNVKLALSVSALFFAAILLAPAQAQEKSVADQETIKLLQLMDKDQNGKVSRQEFMAFMEAEFNRLDKNKDGELDVEELSKLHIGTHRGATK